MTFICPQKYMANVIHNGNECVQYGRCLYGVYCAILVNFVVVRMAIIFHIRNEISIGLENRFSSIFLFQIENQPA